MNIIISSFNKYFWILLGEQFHLFIEILYRLKYNLYFRILASRISELEHRLGSNDPIFPSELLLEGYSSAHVDSDLKLQNEEIIG